MGPYYCFVYGRGSVEMLWVSSIDTALRWIQDIGKRNGLAFDVLYDQDDNAVYWVA